MTGKDAEELLSVGIDIGTTTTQMIASRILVANTASMVSVPRIAIVSKEILFQSEIHFTPLINREEIDAQRVREIIAREYRKAGISPEQVDTGAIIVTGETAKKGNARDLLQSLADLAGNFVVAAAGPLLESVIAGKGAGAASMSREYHRVILNIDVGGGTSNLAVFKDGQLLDTTCINIGGRLIEIEPETSRLKFLAPAAKTIIEGENLDIEEGRVLSLEQVLLLARVMSQAVRSLLRPNSIPSTRPLMMGPPLRLDYPVDLITFSGGVADFIYSDHPLKRIQDGTLYGDIGPFLGDALKRAFAEDGWRVVKPRETIRATVIGAGTQTLNLSGSTINVPPNILPLRNLPVVKPFPGCLPQDSIDLAQGLTNHCVPYWHDGIFEPLALAFKGLGAGGFGRVQQVARVIIAKTEDYLKSGLPLVIITEEDCAKVLGQTLTAMLGKGKNILCLDQVCVEDGDYIDIGQPITEGNTVPVVVKTLVFG